MTNESTPTTEAVLTVTEVRKEYPADGVPVRALDGVSLGVRRGEFVAIMGASGSGKSTLLHLIAGLDAPTAGSIVIANADLARMGDRARTLFRRRSIGVVFQAYNLLPTLTAVENVALPAMLDGKDPRTAEAKARNLLQLVDMGHRFTHRPQALSGGEQQRVAIARALINDPTLILADEPTGNVDSRHAAAIWGLLARLAHPERERDRAGGNHQDTTVVAVTHEASGATYADRVVMLKDGRVAGEVKPGGEDHAGFVAARYTELVG